MIKRHLQDKEKMATLSLMMGMFFLPFGYDALFKLILDWTSSYWTTDFVFYCLSGAFFIAYCYFSGTNPATTLLNKVVDTGNYTIGLINKLVKK